MLQNVIVPGGDQAVTHPSTIRSQCCLTLKSWKCYMGY